MEIKEKKYLFTVNNTNLRNYIKDNVCVVRGLNIGCMYG